MALTDLSRTTLEKGLRSASSPGRRRNGRVKVSNLAENITSISLAPQPFLKWAGGKRALLPEIRLRTPNFQGKYIEPFLGAGAVLFDQEPHLTKVVSDYNKDLIEVYEVVRDAPEELLETLRGHVNTEEHFYEVRAWDRDPDFYTKHSKVERAARFCLMNRLNYNGLYRVNASGQMNVPYGRHTNPDWVQEDVILSVSEFLNVRDVAGNLRTTVLSGDYRKALEHAQTGDWVYLDPPYADTFTHYQSGGFTPKDQTDLRDEILALTERKIPVLLSNSDVPLIRELYADKTKFEIHKVTVRRAIGASNSSRGQVTEVMINNYRAAGL